ncbi:MAG: DEAD/DEAH box helicase family protein [bacterium]|nr:DEAD/DEAH box helicase family protein [bacterium]
MIIPHPHQNDCLGCIADTRAKGGTRALIEMATGLGKTVMVAFDAQRYLKERRGRVLYLCHKNDILYQARNEFESVIGLGRSYGFFHGREKNFHEVDFLFSSFDTMTGWLDMFDPDEFGYIVVDESHHSHADTYLKVIQYFRPNFLIGISATIDRMDKKDIRDVYGSPVFSLPLEKALAEGLLTPVDYRILTDEIQTTGILETPTGQLNISALNRSIFVQKRDEEIVKIIAEHTSKIENPKIILFCPSVKYCDHIATLIPDSLVIHSDIPDKERDIRLEMFRQDMVSTVITVDCFNEGIDIPRANVVVFLRSTASRTIFLQQLGRGLRKSEGKDKVIVLDFVANLERIKMIMEMSQVVEDLVKDRAQSGDSLKNKSSVLTPITLELGTVLFEERQVSLTQLLERILPKTVADIPKLAREYSNKNILPSAQVPVQSSRKCWWYCSTCEYEWQTTPRFRYLPEGAISTCPACAGDVPTEKNNLTITHPELAKEYSDKNPLPANKVVMNTSERILWKCFSCGFEWRTSGYRRAKDDRGCSRCGYKVTDPESKTNAQQTTYLEEKRQELSKADQLRQVNDVSRLASKSLALTMTFQGNTTGQITIRVPRTKP